MATKVVKIEETVGRLDWPNPYKRSEIAGIQETIDYYIPTRNGTKRVKGEEPATTFALDISTAVYLEIILPELISEYLDVVMVQPPVNWGTFTETEWDAFSEDNWSVFEE